MGGFSASAAAALAYGVPPAWGRTWGVQASAGTGMDATVATEWQTWHKLQLPSPQWAAASGSGWLEWPAQSMCSAGISPSKSALALVKAAPVAIFCIADGWGFSISKAMASPTQARKGSETMSRNQSQ